MTFIYALKDGDSIFYIGKTKNLKKRKSQHLIRAMSGYSPKDKKIKEMIALGRMFDLVVLKSCTDEKAAQSEVELIRFYSLKGDKILNVIDNMKYKLSEVEREVLWCLSEDMDTNEIANKLFRSPRTIETIRQKIKEKAGVKTLTGLMIWAVNNDFVCV